MTNLELFDDMHLAEIVTHEQMKNEVEDFKKRIEQALQRDELENLATILAEQPLRTLAEYGPKIMSILSYYTKK